MTILSLKLLSVIALHVPCIYAFAPSIYALGDGGQRGVRSFPIKMMEIWWDGRYISTDNDDDDVVVNPPFTLEEYPDLILREKGMSCKPKFHLKNDSNKDTMNDVQLPVLHVDGHVAVEEENDVSGLVLDSKSEETVGKLVVLKDKAAQEEAMAALGSVEWVVVQGEVDEDGNVDWQKMIPAENLIAAAQASGTKLAFCVDRASDVGGLARALELGVDALCINAAVATEELWQVAFEARQERNSNVSQSSIAPITNAIITGKCWRREVGTTLLADRICVDLIQNLLPQEGCWVGSSAKIQALILSEAASSQYVPTRPFRINAGPVHSYIRMGDGTTTKYLCELQPGDPIEVFNSLTGTSRSVAVGRLKQEVRPCVLVELEVATEDDVDDSAQKYQRGQVFLQQAETVRLGRETGSFVRVTDLETKVDIQQDASLCENNKHSILLRVTDSGTHVGKAYTGIVEER